MPNPEQPNYEPEASAGSDFASAQEELQVRLSRFREDLAEYDLRVREFVREHPLAAVGGAVVLGYLLGRVLRRR